MEHAKLSVEILSHDRTGVKKVIRELDGGIFKGIKDVVKVKPIARMGTGLVVSFLKLIAQVPDVGKQALHIKGLQKMAAGKGSHAINKSIKRALNLKEKQKFISIEEISIKKKKGEKAMKLEVELKDIDLTKTLDVVLKQMKQQQTDKRRKKLETYKENGDAKAAQKLDSNDVLKSGQKLMFQMLEAINSEVDNDRKFALVQSLVAWANDSGLAGIVLKTLAESDGKMGEMIQAMKLEIGEISLTE